MPLGAFSPPHTLPNPKSYYPKLLNPSSEPQNPNLTVPQPVLKLEVDSRSETGFTGIDTSGGGGKRTSVFRGPGFLRHTIDNWEEAGRVLMIVAYAVGREVLKSRFSLGFQPIPSIKSIFSPQVPIAPGKSRLLNRQVFRFKKAPPRKIIGSLPGWLYHKSNNVILECGDKP